MALENQVTFAEVGNPKRVTQLTENTDAAGAYFLTEKVGESAAKKTSYATVESAVKSKVQSEYLQTLSVTPASDKTMSEKLVVGELEKRDDKIVQLEQNMVVVNGIREYNSDNTSGLSKSDTASFTDKSLLIANLGKLKSISVDIRELGSSNAVFYIAEANSMFDSFFIKQKLEATAVLGRNEYDFTGMDIQLYPNDIIIWGGGHMIRFSSDEKHPASGKMIYGAVNVGDTIVNNGSHKFNFLIQVKQESNYDSTIEYLNKATPTFDIKKELSSNLFNYDDPERVVGKLINSNGGLSTIGSGPNDWFSTGFIDIDNADSIIISNAGAFKGVYSLAFYDANKVFVQNSYKLISGTTFDGIVACNSTYKFIRVTLSNKTGWQVNKGAIVLPYEAYSLKNYKLSNSDKDGMEWRFKPDVNDDELKKLIQSDLVDVELFSPRKIYTVCNDITKDERVAGDRNYAVGLYLDHMMILPSHSNIKFNLTQSDKLPIYSHFTSYGVTESGRGWIWNEDGSIIKQTQKTAKLEGVKNTQEITFLQISTLNTATANSLVIVMCIGDSVTEGYLANINMPYDDAPTAYWQWAKMFFDFDKKQNNNSKYDALFVGQRKVADYKSKYTDGTMLNNRACAEGKGGSKLSEYLRYKTVGGAPNNFYDESKQSTNKFSVLYYLSKFRTMDDLGVRLSGTAGQTVTGSDGKQYTIGTEVTDINAWDVCTPTHFVIQLGYNDGDRSGYIEDMIAMMDILQAEIPNCTVGFSLPDCPGTYFPELYPQYGRDSASMYPLSYFEGNAKESHATFYSMNKKLIEIENVSQKRYYIPTYFISPTALSAPYRSNNFASFLSSGAFDDRLGVQGWASPNLHPNNHAHAAWGYEVYAWLKYTLAI